MSTTVLLTAAIEDSDEIKALLESKDTELLHLPLEHYKPLSKDSFVKETFELLPEFENIIYGSLRNAKFFMSEVESRDKMEAVRNCLNLTPDERTAAFLEEAGIPAVCTYAGGKSINLVEFMLRLRRMGPTLYPCGSHNKEEIPGFLEELDIPVKELELFDLEGPTDNDLQRYQKELEEKKPEVVLFHSRRAVNRILAAFPDLDYKTIEIISADKGISKKLTQKNIPVKAEAEGSWKSMAEFL